MMLLTFIVCLVLAACSAGHPKQQDVLIKENLFKSDYVIYNGQHDIVILFVPLFQFNFEAMKSPPTVIPTDQGCSSEETEVPYRLFFVEGDYNNDEVINKGLYGFTRGKATKLLENGRDAIATQSDTVYFGAADGIYKYDNGTNTASKYGTVTDSVGQLAYDKKTDSIYYLTDENEVYKLSEDATSSVKIPGLTDVQEIGFGNEGWLYYYDSNKVFYVVKFEDGGVPQKITGLPENLNNVTLLAPFHGLERGIIVFADKHLYSVESDRYVEQLPIVIEATITAQAPQSVMFNFYGKDKKIYAFNIKELVATGALKVPMSKR